MREIRNHPASSKDCLKNAARCPVKVTNRPHSTPEPATKLAPLRLSWVVLASLALAGCWSSAPLPNPPAGSYLSRDFEVSTGQATEHIQGAAVSDEFFAGGKLRPVLGRTILPREHRSMHVALLSYGLWSDKFRADAAVVGKTLQVNGQNVTIVGVMPKGFSVPEGARLWVPLAER